MPENTDTVFAIPRLKKIHANGLAKTHAARAENGLDLPHLIPGNPAPKVLFNSAPPGTTFVEFVQQAYQDAKAKGLVYRPRKDQVLAIEGLLTASPAFFRPDEPNIAGKYIPARVNSLNDRVLPFLKKMFGENLVRVELQLDEVTPHWQYAILPFDRRGHWSAKNCMSKSFLGKLWDEWYLATKDLGLKRGQPGMIATHTEVREYYAAAHQFANMGLNAKQEIQVKPFELEALSRTALLNPKKVIDDINSKIKKWADAQTTALNAKLAPLLAAVAGQQLKSRRAKEHRLSAEKLTSKNRELAKSVAGLEEKLAHFSPVTPKAVAERLNIAAIPKQFERADAIDLLCKLEALSMDEALGWLSAEFGAHAAASTLAERLKPQFLSDVPSLPKPKIIPALDHQTLIERQVDALRADLYEILVSQPKNGAVELKRYLGKGKDRPRWKSGEIGAELPRLKAENALGQILLVPASDDYVYFVSRGQGAFDALREAGVEGCLSLKLPDGAEQVVIRLPKDSQNEKRTKKLSSICRSLGLGIHPVDVNAPLHLAGFRMRDVHRESANTFEKTYIVEIAYAFDCTYRAGIEWAKAPRPDFKPEW